jgi:phage gp36-like protein
MPVETLPYLFCNAGDVQDYLSIEGVNLRLDDDSSATGQYVQASANAIVGATSIPVTPLTAPLDAGDTLFFYAGNMPVPGVAVLSAPAGLGATSLTVNPLTVQVNQGSVAIDSGVNVVEYNRINVAINWATSQVKLYCGSKYDDSALASSWTVKRWATIIAAYRLCRRRTNPCPATVEEDYKEAILELKDVQKGNLYIEDVGLRTTECPAWSNVQVDSFGYDLRKVRVQRPISEGTPTQYPQNVSWPAEFCYEI